MNVPLVAGGLLALLASAIHGVGGEVWVVRKLSPYTLPSTRFGRARMTRTMIHVTWHITTLAFFGVGAALLLSGAVFDGDTARGIGLVVAAEFTAFAAVAMWLGIAYPRSPRTLLSHPGPAVLTLTAALAWWGAL